MSTFRNLSIALVFLSLFAAACSESGDSQCDADCDKSEVWDGEYCRGDGRCSPKVFETHWQLTGDARKIVLPFDPDYPGASCDFQVLWGDEAVGTDITKLPRVTDCVNVANRTHEYLEIGRYNVKIIGTYDGWGVGINEQDERYGGH